MKQQTHPVVRSTIYSCGNCGTLIAAESTRPADAILDSCSNCHPAYTGKALKEVLGSRVDSFNNRYKPK